jgi:hypothetical protein
LARGICFRWHNAGLKGFDSPTPVLGQILPCGFVAFDQGDPLGAHPVFDCLLASDGIADILKHFEVHQSIDLVLLGEPLDFSRLVLRYSPSDVVGSPV